MTADTLTAEGFEGIGHHAWTQIGAADPDAHHVANRLPAEAFAVAVMNAGNERLHVIQRGLNIRNDIMSGNPDVSGGRAAQGRMQHRSMLGIVESGAAEQVFNSLGQSTGASQC